MIKQNPFSLYDFFGYFIPGAIAFYIGVLFLEVDDIDSLGALLEILPKNEKFSK